MPSGPTPEPQDPLQRFHLPSWRTEKHLLRRKSWHQGSGVPLIGRCFLEGSAQLTMAFSSRLLSRPMVDQLLWTELIRLQAVAPNGPISAQNQMQRHKPQPTNRELKRIPAFTCISRTLKESRLELTAALPACPSLLPAPTCTFSTALHTPNPQGPP